MFCSNCGKSLRPDDEKCPHCGAAVGESRFDGNPPYTGAQEKLRPGKAVRSYGKHYSTEFVVNREERDELPSDTDSVYRTAVGINGKENTEEQPRLFNAYEDEDDYSEPQEEPEEEKTSKPVFALRFLRKNPEAETEGDEAENAEAPANEEIGSDGLTASEREMISANSEFEPTAPTGISSDVSSYMEKLKENEAKKLAAEKAKKQRREKVPAEELDDDAYFDALNKEEKAAKKAKKGWKLPKTVKEEEPEKVEKAEKPVKAAKPSKPRHARVEEPEEPETESEEFDEFGDFEDESKPKKKLSLSFLKLPKRKPKQEEPDDEPADIENIEELTPDEDADYDEDEYERDEKRQNRFRLIKNIAVIVVALAVIVGAVIGVSSVREKSKTAPIESVTLSLWNEGISVMESRTKDAYRKGMLSLYDRNNPATYLSLQAKFTEDLDGLSSLMPESPLQHDQVFINALKAIQESINNCLSNDALSMTDGTRTASEKDAESALRWEAVQDLVVALRNSTNVGQLEAIIKGERVELIQQATPTPVPTATPAPYSTLAKGAQGPAVNNLQTRLTELGFMNSTIDGDYGNKTKTAVEKFQQAAGLDVTGIADVATQELLFSAGAPRSK